MKSFLHRIFLLILIQAVAFGLHAQYQNIWAFGMNAGLDFNQKDANGYPTSIRTRISTNEGVATICDINGKLLFYTDGSFIYDKDYNITPNGRIFNPSISGSTTQGTLIVPIDLTRYYVFSLSCIEQNNPRYNGKLYYSIVDMKLNNGLGDVEANNKAILIDSNMSEQLTNVVGSNCKRWLVTAKYANLDASDNYDQYQILFYQIFSDSISSKPVINTIDKLYDQGVGYGALVSSHDFNYLVDIRQKGAVLYKMNSAEGKVSEPIQIDKTRINNGYYACFSPDNTKLYLSGSAVTLQFDITNYNEMSINQSGHFLNNPSAFSGMQLGPDNRIYVASSYGGTTIHVIDSPNEKGAACNFRPNAIKLLQGTSSVLGLPNNYKNNVYCDIGKLYDSCYFENNIIGTYRTLDSNYYRWNTGDTSKYITVTQPGTYIVEYSLGWYNTQDTFVVRRTKKVDFGYRQSTGDCFTNYASQYYLIKEVDDTFSYSVYWIKNNNDTVSTNVDTINVVAPGHYAAVVVLNGCVDYFPFQVEALHFPPLSIYTNYNCYNEPAKAFATLVNSVADSIFHEYYWLNQRFDTLSTSDTIYGLSDGGYYLYFKTTYCDTLIPFSIITKGGAIDFRHDSLVCQNQLISAENVSSDYYTRLHWYLNEEFISDATNHHLTIPHAGENTLTLIAEGNVCKDTLSKLITVDSQYAGQFTTSPDSICVGEKITITPLFDETATHLSWSFHKQSFESHHVATFTQAFESPGIIPINLQTNYRVCDATTYTKSIYVFETPEIYLGNDSSICYQGSTITLQNLNNPSLVSTYQWSTGDTSRALQVKNPGTYWLKQIAEPIGCTGYGSIEISKDCFVDIPNAFTPNGDGVNDYFFPRKWLTNGVVKFHLQIFNRWGQLLYETHQTEGLGWDGKWNGKDQPMGVYVYRILVTFKNGLQENYEGNVTLVR